jgi:hypothetical protein
MHGPCNHVRAVQLHDELVKAQLAKQKRRTGLVAQRHPDGEITWERHEHADGSTAVYLPQSQPPTAPDDCGCVLRNKEGACSHDTEPLPPITDEQAARIFGKL